MNSKASLQPGQARPGPAKARAGQGKIGQAEWLFVLEESERSLPVLPLPLSRQSRELPDKRLQSLPAKGLIASVSRLAGNGRAGRRAA